jgi:hypothetical protein
MTNKKSRKRAFFVYVILCLFYAVVMFRIPEKLNMTRIADSRSGPSKSSLLPASQGSGKGDVARLSDEKPVGAALPAKGGPAGKGSVKQAAEGTTAGRADMEPSLLISVPIVCYAVSERWLEKDSLIFTKKDAYNNVAWRKPIEILKDHDEEGLRSILTTIGKKRVVAFMKKEGVSVASNLSPEDLILGKGYRVDKQRLLALYDRYVADTCSEVLPFATRQAGVARGTGGFYFTKGRDSLRESAKAPEAEWMMPNLVNLPIRLAIQKVAPHTSRVKVHGSGHVMSQSPRAFERLKGEPECVIQGRSPSE